MNDDSEPVYSALQAMTILVKNMKSNKISETQLQVLLGYAEEDIYDQSRQATAFGLLKVSTEARGKTRGQEILSSLSSVFTCIQNTPGDPVQEAHRPRDGGGVKKSGQAVCQRGKQYDQNSLSTGMTKLFLLKQGLGLVSDHCFVWCRST